MATTATSKAELIEQLGRSFKSAMVAVRRLRGRETHRPGQLSYAQYGLLFGLAEGGEMSSAELARRADVSAPTASQMLEALEQSGLVTRHRSATDKRVVLTSLTERGEMFVAERRALIEPRWRAVLDEFDEDQLHAAGAVLARLADFFDEMQQDPPADG